jgi:hypothetical protein
MSSKQLFAPVPLRAMALDLSGLDLRVLVCIAAHDRMSLATGKGQGCRASNERMSQMVGCHYARLCSTLSKLVGLGLLSREPMGRYTVYRVIYTDDDRLLFGNMTRRADAGSSAVRVGDALGLTGCEMASDPAAIGCQTASETAVICCQHTSETGENLPETPSQYIPLNGRNTFCETGEYNSSEEATPAALAPRPFEELFKGTEKRRQKAGRSRVALAENVGGQLAILERALTAGDPVDKLTWYEWLGDAVCHENPNVSARAVRVSEMLVEAMTGDEYQQWQERCGPASLARAG